MNLEERIHAFSQLGDFLKKTSDLEFTQKLKEAEIRNHWFTLENQKEALKVWANKLTIETLEAWLTPYDLKEQFPRIDFGDEEE